MKKILISVIIPVYNNEIYIEQCIQSVLEQSYRNIEIIVINDGSTDNTSIILKKLENIDQRLKVIDSENHGVSHARNLGLKNAKGEGIIFVDSDDYLCKDCIKKSIKYFNDFDMIMYGYNVIEESKIKKYIYKRKNTFINNDKIYTSIVLKDLYWNQPWNKLYHKKIIDDNNIFFDEDVSVGEDLLFNFEYSKNMNTFISLPEALYNYRKNESSIMNSMNNNNLINKNTVLFYKLIQLSKHTSNKSLCDAIIYHALIKGFNIIKIYKKLQINIDEKIINYVNYNYSKYIYKKNISMLFRIKLIIKKIQDLIL